MITLAFTYGRCQQLHLQSDVQYGVDIFYKELFFAKKPQKASKDNDQTIKCYSYNNNNNNNIAFFPKQVGIG